jgi:outer membrane protein assembly factor BamB
MVSAGMVRGQSSGALVSEALAGEAGLKQDWQIRLPIKTGTGESVDRLFVFDPYLLVLTNQNYLFCRNRVDGSYRFELQIAEKGLPVVDPLYLENRILFLIGSQLKVLDPASGMIVRKADLSEAGESRNASFAKNDRFVYVAGVDRRIHAFRIQEDGDYVRLFTATADNDSAITSIHATNDRVYFATLTGNVVAMEAGRPRKIWQYNASGPISAPLVPGEGVLYAGSQDTKLYKISASNGTLLWDTPFFAGDKILNAPYPGKTVLYLNAGISGLYGISEQTGKEIWNVPNGKSVLCESGERAYVYAQPGVLVVMNNATGQEVFSLNFSEVSCYGVNLLDSRMYVADKQGRVACISVP